ncbi:MAG: class B sortase [Lachnospiraceae bacterium]|nr:class B sortase [Lachnospiraceae bacterium]MCI9342393.1 class B sortase [Lachnospiraceae bacterium]
MRRGKAKQGHRMGILVSVAIAVFLTAVGCGSPDGQRGGSAESSEEKNAADGQEGNGDGLQDMALEFGTGNDNVNGESGTGLAGESAADGHVDFEVLQEENPDIFAWLYVPGTDIDYPVLQSPVSDDYYKSHGQNGQEDESGALYTEMPNMMNMCDFNTIIHGKDNEDGDLFAGLHKFEDPDFFEKNEEFYIYLPGNVLTYEVFAAYYDDGSDILRRFDYTTYAGCEAHLEQIYAAREMGKQLREGWEDLMPYHFLVTLDGSVREDGKQYVVIGALTGDAAGVIDRVILD